MQIPDYRVVILGAGESVRGELPAAVVPIADEGRLLDWLLTAFAGLPDPEIDFVSGFMAQEVMRHYRDIRFHHNPDWRRTGPAKSLSMAPLSSNVATFICYSDVVFRAGTVSRMNAVESDLVVAIDRRWKVRYDGRSRSELEDAEKVSLVGGSLSQVGKSVPTSAAEAEFAGVVRLSGAMAKRLENVLTSTIFGDGDGLPDVLNFLLEKEVDRSFVDVEGEWAELNAPQDLARFVLGTKAESLERLRPLLKSGSIEPLERITYRAWAEDRAGTLARIRRAFPETSVIVRSSSLLEDGWDQSAAGAFKSVLDVPVADDGRLGDALDEVFASYGDVGQDQQVLVQEMLKRVSMSGVVMTRTHSQGAPYFVINYDDTSSRTDTVTSGAGADLKTLFLHRGRSADRSLPAELDSVMEAVRELERLVGHDSLDIEFAVTGEGRVHVLQVRPIATTHENRTIHDERIRDGIRDAERFIRDRWDASPFVVGASTQFSVMTDWNPAEMIGTKPDRLAFSLYRYVITDATWARQRAEYGYRDVRPTNLIVDILGRPYVDVRADFNSWIPASLEDDLAERLVDHYLHHLAQQPELHDKVEFDVVFTCWTFDHDEQAARLAENPALLDADLRELREALHAITRDGIRRVAADTAALERSQRRFERIRASGIAPLERAYLHVENAREEGALHFSHLARAAFVAVSLIRSLVRKGVLTQAESDAFFASVETVSTRMQHDSRRVSGGEMEWEEFVSEYGHLRPGTYDINSARYDRAPEEFLRPMVEQAVRVHGAASSKDFAWSAKTRQGVTAELESSGLGVDFDDFVGFLRLAIEGREYGKFVFTRDISAALECLAEYATEHFISREEMAHVRIEDLLGLRAADFENVSVWLKERARLGRDAHRINQAFCLPDHILGLSDLSCFEYRQVVPNFITQGKVRAPVTHLTQSSSPNVDLEGKIVLIANADPGFDWIFAQRLAGLITMYGGANSHMAIRMAEFELPGVTGVGELIFEKCRNAEFVELDCSARQVRVVR